MLATVRSHRPLARLARIGLTLLVALQLTIVPGIATSTQTAQIAASSSVNAGDTLTLISGNDLTLKGAVAQGGTVLAAVGGDLTIESLQDRAEYDSRQSNKGLSLSVPLTPAGVIDTVKNLGGSISVGKTTIDSNYQSVTEQSGLKAGDGGFNIDVKGNTTLTGGAILSTQEALEQGKNTFKTGGTLTLSDIENKAEYEGKGYSVNLGAVPSPEGKLTPGGSSAGIGQVEGETSSQTLAAITGIAGNQDARTGDAETGLQKIFDADKVQKQLDAQIAITQKFGELAPKAAADYAKTQVDRLLEEAKTETDSDKRTALLEEAERWGDGGSYRIALHTALGAAVGNVEGALGAGIAAGAAPWLTQVQDQLAASLKEAGLSEDLANKAGGLIAQGAAAGLGSLVGGTAGASMGLNVEANNRQLHPNELKFLADPDRVKRYIAYIKETTGVSLSQSEATKALNQYGAAMVDQKWTELNGRDPATEAFIIKEAGNSKSVYFDSSGNANPLFSVTPEEYRNEFINLKQLFSAGLDYRDPAVLKFLADNSITGDPNVWREEFIAGQKAGLKQSNEENSVKTLISSLTGVPGYLYDSATSDEVGLLDDQQMKAYYQNLLKLQGRNYEAGYIYENDWATTQRLMLMSIPLGELAAAGVGKLLAKPPAKGGASKPLDSRVPTDGEMNTNPGTGSPLNNQGGNPQGLTSKDFPVISTEISQKQFRHVAGRPELDARGGGSYMDSVADAQTVLNAYHAGQVTILGTNPQGFPVVRFEGISGTNVNISAGILNQPTNVFIIKGTKSPSIVPTNPNWSPK